MTKTICDFCGKEMTTDTNTNINDMNFAISKNGKKYDMCIECRESFWKWWQNRKENKQ